MPRQPGGSPANYKRAALEIMEYTQGRSVARRAVPTDSDEIEPGRRSPRTRAVRPASASVNRPRGSMPPSASASYSSSSHAQRPSSAYPSSHGGAGSDPYASYSRAAASELEDARDSSGSGVSADPYVKLRHKLFALIVEHRIFRERAILKLLDKAKQINSHMNQFKLDRVLEEVWDTCAHRV